MADIPIYPQPNAESFVTLQAAGEIAQGLFPSRAVEWAKLTPQQQESFLVQTFYYMINCDGLVIPPDYGKEIGQGTPAGDFMIAQVALALYFMSIDLFDVGEDRAVIEERVGSLMVKYDPAYKIDNPVPEFFNMIMRKYGCGKKKGFSQTPTKES